MKQVCIQLISREGTIIKPLAKAKNINKLTLLELRDIAEIYNTRIKFLVQ